MDQPLFNQLQQVGLTEGEAKAYLALVELGTSTVGPVVKLSGVAYSNIYTVLHRLIQKGLVSSITKENTKQFQAGSPSNLLHYCEQREHELKDQRLALASFIPQIEELRHLAPEQEASLFIGIDGLRTAYETMTPGMQPKDEGLFFYIHEKEYAREADLFYLSIREQLRKVPQRGITNLQGKESLHFKQVDFINLRYVDFPIPGNIDLCPGKVMFTSWKKPVIAVLVRSESIYHNFKLYFESVWQAAVTGGTLKKQHRSSNLHTA